MQTLFTIIRFLPYLIICTQFPQHDNRILYFRNISRILNSHQIPLRFCINQLEPVLHAAVTFEFTQLPQFKKVNRQLIGHQFFSLTFQKLKFGMIVFAVKQLKVDDVDTNRLLEFAVFFTGIQFLAVQLCPVKEGTLLEIRFPVDLHLNIDNPSVNIQFQIQTAEFLVKIFGSQFHITDIDSTDTFTGDFKQVRNKRRNNFLILGIAEYTLENNIQFELNNFFLSVHWYHAPFSSIIAPYADSINCCTAGFIPKTALQSSVASAAVFMTAISVYRLNTHFNSSNIRCMKHESIACQSKENPV